MCGCFTLDRTVLVGYNVIVADQYSSCQALFCGKKEGEKMIANKRKLEIAMANACMNPYDLCKVAEIRYQTYQRITSGKDAKQILDELKQSNKYLSHEVK